MYKVNEKEKRTDPIDLTAQYHGGQDMPSLGMRGHMAACHSHEKKEEKKRNVA